MLGIRNAVPASTRLSEWTESPSACSVPPPLNYGLYSPTTQPTSVCLSVLSQAGCSVHWPSVCPAGSAASRPCWPCALPASVRPPAARPAESTDGILSLHPSFCPPHPLLDPQQEPPSPSFSASPLLHQPQTRPVQPQAALGVCPSVRLHLWPPGTAVRGAGAFAAVLLLALCWAPGGPHGDLAATPAHSAQQHPRAQSSSSGFVLACQQAQGTLLCHKVPRATLSLIPLQWSCLHPGPGQAPPLHICPKTSCFGSIKPQTRASPALLPWALVQNARGAPLALYSPSLHQHPRPPRAIFTVPPSIPSASPIFFIKS